jgi:nucleoside-diphosphate-sugar epimerase
MSEARPVLVTGGAGFAGGYVVRRLLDDGDRVVVYDLADYRDESRFVIGEQIENVVTERGSIDNWPSVLSVIQRHQPRAIAHLAGIMDIGLLDRNPILALKVNVEGTCNILEGARLLGVERVVVLSTIGVHGRKVYEPIDGDHPTVTSRDGPLGAYSAAKLAGEAFAYAYNQAFGLDIRIVRPSALYGFGMSWFAPNYVKNIVEPAVLGERVRLLAGGRVPRDYAHVADLAKLVSAVLACPAEADRVFYAATGLPLRTGGDVARIVRELVPDADIEVADEWTESDSAELRFRGEISIVNCVEQLGWSPTFPQLESGIDDYIQRFRAYLAAGGVPTARPVLSGAPGS